jgi:hypothetical protein
VKRFNLKEIPIKMAMRDIPNVREFIFSLSKFLHTKITMSDFCEAAEEISDSP